MKYLVQKFFTDLQDADHPYEVGSEYPRKGLDVSPERIAELMSSENAQGTVLIAEAPEKKEPVKKTEAKKASK